MRMKLNGPSLEHLNGIKHAKSIVEDYSQPDNRWSKQSFYSIFIEVIYQIIKSYMFLIMVMIAIYLIFSDK